MVKNPPDDARDAGLIPGLGRSLEEEVATAPVFVPGKFHPQRSLAGYTVHGVTKELDSTERLRTHIRSYA